MPPSELSLRTARSWEAPKGVSSCKLGDQNLREPQGGEGRQDAGWAGEKQLSALRYIYVYILLVLLGPRGLKQRCKICIPTSKKILAFIPPPRSQHSESHQEVAALSTHRLKAKRRNSQIVPSSLIHPRLHNPSKHQRTLLPASPIFQPFSPLKQLKNTQKSSDTSITNLQTMVQDT